MKESIFSLREPYRDYCNNTGQRLTFREFIDLYLYYEMLDNL